MRQRKYLILTLTLVGLLVVNSSPRRPMLGPLASDVFLTLVALAVFLVVFQGWRERVVAFAAAAAAIVVDWSHYLQVAGQHEVAQAVAYHALMAAFFGFAVAAILHSIFDRMFARQAMTVDEVFGAVCGYLLAAGTWANAYAVTDLLVPGSFSLSPAMREFADWNGRKAVLNYFSVVTLTTMGYGDITPVHSPATALAMLEAVFGQFYIAVVVAALVGLRLAQMLGPKDPESR